MRKPFSVLLIVLLIAPSALALLFLLHCSEFMSEKGAN